MESIVPADVSLETFNSQYMQQNSQSAGRVLAAAQVALRLHSPLAEYEDAAFGTLRPEVDCDPYVRRFRSTLHSLIALIPRLLQTAVTAWKSLQSLNSSRVEEFRTACDARFELSTDFKTAEERERLLAELRAYDHDDPPEAKGKPTLEKI